jgi:hypothetical protein
MTGVGVMRKRERERHADRELSKHYIDFGVDAVTRRQWLNMNVCCMVSLNPDFIVPKFFSTGVQVN